MRKSKADTAETRKRILATASSTFLREGISTTAIADVMVAAGLTQGGFYRHFDSKEQLVAEATTTAFDEIFAALEAGTAGRSPREAVEEIVRLYLYQLLGPDDAPQCPLANLSCELRFGDEQVKLAALEGYSRMVKLIASYLMRLNYTDYVGVAESVVSVMTGAVSISGVAPDPATSEAILVNAQKTVRLILEAAPTSAALTKKK